MEVWIYFEDKADIICWWIGHWVWGKEGSHNDSWVLGLNDWENGVGCLFLLNLLLPWDLPQQPLQHPLPERVHQLLGFLELHLWLLPVTPWLIWSVPVLSQISWMCCLGHSYRPWLWRMLKEEDMEAGRPWKVKPLNPETGSFSEILGVWMLYDERCHEIISLTIVVWKMPWEGTEGCYGPGHP